MKRRTNHEGQPRLQTSQRTGAVDTTGQKCTHPKARESKQGTAQPPQKSRTAGGDNRTTNKALEASRAKKHYYTAAQSNHNTNGSSLTQGAEPSEPLQARWCRRSTDNIREGLPPNLCNQRSSRSGRWCQKRQKPPRATSGRVSSANRRPRRKSTAQGRIPSDAPKTPQTQQTELHRRSRTGNWSQKGCLTP